MSDKYFLVKESELTSLVRDTLYLHDLVENDGDIHYTEHPTFTDIEEYIAAEIRSENMALVKGVDKDSNNKIRIQPFSEIPVNINLLT